MPLLFISAYWEGMRFLENLLRLLVGIPTIFVGLSMCLGAIVCFAIDTKSTFASISVGGMGLVFLYVGIRLLPKRPKPIIEEESWRDGPATAKQKSFARDLGIEFPPDISKGDLSDLISEETER